jgi:hypothetical protein
MHVGESVELYLCQAKRPELLDTQVFGDVIVTSAGEMAGAVVIYDVP